MAQRVDYEKLMARKEKSIERAIDKKQESIEFQSTRRDAIELVKLEYDPAWGRQALQHAIVDWMNFLFAMREEDQAGEPDQSDAPEVEPISEVQTAIKAVEETFPGAKEVQTKTIKNPDEKLTAPQLNMIQKLFEKAGVKDPNQQTGKAAMQLGLKNLVSLSDLNKGQASGLISKLLGKEKK